MSLKSRLLVARAEGAIALAELSLERGDARDASRLFLSQARDLTRRGVGIEVRRRAWFGALRAFESGLAASADWANPDLVPEIIGGLLPCSRADLPQSHTRYASFRPLITQMLAAGQPQVHRLTWALCDWFEADPRPHYAHGRALELLLDGATDPSRRWTLAREGLSAYRTALAASVGAGAQDRWEMGLRLRMMRIVLAHLSADDPEAMAEALSYAESFETAQFRHLPPSYQLVVASAWLRSGRAMRRLRALDAIETLMDADPRFRAPGLDAVESYLESLDWSFYSTEQDRARAIAARFGRGGGRTAIYLDLLQDLHGALGRHSQPGKPHLQRLLEAELQSDPSSTGVIYYKVALALSEGEPLTDVLAIHNLGPDQPRLDLDSPLAMALESLRQRDQPDRGAVRELLLAFCKGKAQVPHAQATFSLLFPVLAARWGDWAELRVEMRRAVGGYIKLAPAPSFGFAVVGQAMGYYGESLLAEQAARRALASPEVDAAAMDKLLRALAAGALTEGAPKRAVEVMLPLWGQEA